MLSINKNNSMKQIREKKHTIHFIK